MCQNYRRNVVWWEKKDEGTMGSEPAGTRKVWAGTWKSWPLRDTTRLSEVRWVRSVQEWALVGENGGLLRLVRVPSTLMQVASAKGRGCRCQGQGE